jgi:hypothetical protein
MTVSPNTAASRSDLPQPAQPDEKVDELPNMERPHTMQRKTLTVRNSWQLKHHFGFPFLALGISIVPWGKVAVAEDAQGTSSQGLAAHLGVAPTHIMQGPARGYAEGSMPGAAPMGRHEYSAVAAPLDVASGARDSNAPVTAGLRPGLFRLSIQRDGEPRRPHPSGALV